MRRNVVATCAVALVGMVLLAGCSQSDGGRASKAVDTAARGASGGGGAVDGPAARAKGDQAAVPEGSPAQAGPVKGPAAAKSVLTGTALIRTADITVEVVHEGSVAAQANRAGQIATAAGGQVFADDRTAGKAPTAALTLKVPGDSLASVLTKLSGLGKETSRRSSTRDVTTEVADVNSRVRSARLSIDQLRALFSQATKIGDLIALESELSQREAELESLQAQQRALAAQTEMATVTLNLTTAAASTVAKQHHDKGGFLGGLERGWRAFAAAAGALATALGTALPFAGLTLLIIGAAVILRRRLRSSAPPVIAPPDAA